MPKLTLSFKGRVLDVFHLEQGETVIGRDSNCEIAIDSLAIAPTQISIRLDGEQCRLEALDEKFAVLVNHNNVTSAELQHGDVIQVGKHTLNFAEDALELGANLQTDLADPTTEAEVTAVIKEAPPLKGVLQIVSGGNIGRIIPLNRNMTRIGRVGGDCAIIARRDSGYYISHLEGPNPPQINKQPIGDESQLLNDGDTIKVGNTQMQFHI